MMTEGEFLELVRERLDHPVAGVPLGIGDDAALLRVAGRGDLAVTADMLIDGVDFLLHECGYEAAGRKAIAKNVSDLAAMGVEPWCAVLSVALPVGVTVGEAGALLDGVADAGSRLSCPVVGGDTKRSPGPLVLSVQAIGVTGQVTPVTRSGARTDDRLAVTGALGGSSLGRHLDFEPRVTAGRRLAALGVSAMIDLSDGLATDLRRLCDASGVGAEIDAGLVPVSDAARALSRSTGRDEVEHALCDGEDYELLFAADAATLDAARRDAGVAATVTEIGRCLPRADGVQLRRDGRARPLEVHGFEHRFGAEER